MEIWNWKGVGMAQTTGPSAYPWLLGWLTARPIAIVRAMLLTLLIYGVFATSLLQAQGPYRLGKADIAVCAGGAALSGTSLYLQSRVTPLTTAQLSNLDVNAIPKFDRWVAGRWNTTAKYASDILVPSAFLAALCNFGEPKVRQDWKTVTVMGIETGLIAFGLNNSTKSLALRTRPFLYGGAAPMDEKLKPDARFSFFSGHTTFSAAACFFGAKVYFDYHPTSKWRPVVGAAAALIPAGIGTLRMIAGKHFPTDVLVGYAVGAATGILVPALHKTGRKTDVSLVPTLGGAGLYLSF
jgi:membrane-associated phospholipid phosphatase